MKKENWLWMPHAAHFVLGYKCCFHLATYVGKYIVSTVGELWLDTPSRIIHASAYDPQWLKDHSHLQGDAWDAAYFKRFGYAEKPGDARYETMVFSAERMPKDGCKACLWKINVRKDHDFRRYSTPEEARANHYRLCRKYSRKK